MTDQTACHGPPPATLAPSAASGGAIGRALGLAADAAARRAGRPAGRPMRLLVAEDNETSRMLAEAMLSADGHEVVAVANGAEAVEAVGRSRFDAVLMDIQMPVMDGVAATAAIRALPGTGASTPVIALTADVAQRHCETFRKAGVDNVVPKPIDWTSLREALAGAVDDRPENGLPDLDPTKLNEFAEVLKPERMRSLIALVPPDLMARLADLKAAAAGGDVELSKHVAHTLRGAAGGYGAVKVYALATRIMSGAGGIGGISAVVEELDVAVPAAAAAILAWLEARKSAA